ncbi:ABC transporter substrate-binding protein [Brevibacillus dissolubilis]|uniref:ABC transporter substrate-binding protein n=1 Tax=Brevibacillus dissolubilis TaxID=1844116 RepID=UPI001117A166|nr:ABC transporter substrate-binding protein [Brevibacillus dissolubilis]
MKPTWKRLSNILLTSTLALGLTACGAGTSTTSTGTPEQGSAAEPAASSQTPTELTVALDWYPNAVHSFLYAAEEQGYFKEENLKVNLQMPSDANDPLKMVAAGQVDLAISYQTTMVQARSESVPVVSIAALVREPLNIIMTREDSGLTSPKQLEGKNIGYPSVPIDEQKVREVVKADGGDAGKLTFTDIGFDIVPALTGKKVDAVVGGYINHEKLILEKNGIPVNVFKPSDFGVPNYYELVLATSDATLEKKKDALQAFVRAAAKGQDYVEQNKEAALKSLLDKQSSEFPLEADIEKQSLDILIPLMDAGDKAFGYQKKEDWEQLIKWMKEKQLIGKDVVVDEVMKNVVE